MKKAQAKKFIGIAILIVMAGLVILAVFFGRAGLITDGIAQVPVFINTIIGKIQERSPAANSVYFISELVGNYNFAKDQTTHTPCFIKLENANNRMVNGYVSLVRDLDEVTIQLRPENYQEGDADETDLHPEHVVKGSICLIYGESAEQLVDELNRNIFQQIGNLAGSISGTILNSAANIGKSFARLFGSDVQYNSWIYTYRPDLDLDKEPLDLDELDILIGRNGLEQIVINGDPYKISNYMVYGYNEICFIALPLNPNQRRGAPCEIIDNAASDRCFRSLRGYTC